MPKNKDLKRRVRQHMAKTGMSYCAAMKACGATVPPPQEVDIDVVGEKESRAADQGAGARAVPPRRGDAGSVLESLLGLHGGMLGAVAELRAAENSVSALAAAAEESELARVVAAAAAGLHRSPWFQALNDVVAAVHSNEWGKRVNQFFLDLSTTEFGRVVVAIAEAEQNGTLAQMISGPGPAVVRAVRRPA
jgi:hypothetical protein